MTYQPFQFLVVRAGRTSRIVRVIKDEDGMVVATRFLARKNHWSKPYRVTHDEVLRVASHEELRTMRPR